MFPLMARSNESGNKQRMTRNEFVFLLRLFLVKVITKRQGNVRTTIALSFSA
jgi:hypothetical protein